MHKWSGFKGIRSLIDTGLRDERAEGGGGRNSRNVTSAAIGLSSVADPRLSLVRPLVVRALRTAHRGSTIILSHTCNMSSACCLHFPLCFYEEFYEESTWGKTWLFARKKHRTLCRLHPKILTRFAIVYRKELAR